MRTLLIFVVLACLFFPIHAQELTQSVRGHVIDADSKFPLTGASVVLFNKIDSIGTTTDIDGSYVLKEVSIGRREVHISYLGYKERIVQNVIVNTAKEVILDVALEESAMDLDAIVVTSIQNGEPLNEMATLSARQFSIAETDRYAGSRGDVARMAASYAGVQTEDDANNDIVVRSNSRFTLLWKLEGLNIPNPNHFKSPGFQGGAVTLLNNKYLASSDFYTGAFPAEFGNALGGVFNLRMRNGNNQQHEYSFLLGVLGTEIMGEGPINREKKSSYLFNYRYSTLDLILKLGLNIGTSAIPFYQDAAFRLNFPQKNGANFALWGVGGNYRADVKRSRNNQPTQELYGKSDRDQYYFGNMGVIGMSYTKPLNTDTYFRANLGVGYNEYNRQDSLVYRRLEDGLYKIDSIQHFQDITQGDARINSSFFVNKKIGQQHVIKYGTDFDVYFAQITDSVRVVDTNSPLFNNFQQLYFADNDMSILSQPYFQWKYRPNAKLTLNLGVHAQYFSLTNEVSSLEPRFGISYTLPNKQSLKFGTGLYSQVQPMFAYYAINQVDNTALSPNLEFNKSIHVVAAYNRLLGKKMRLNTELYYQYLYNIPVDASPTSWSLLSASTSSNSYPSRQAVNGDGAIGTQWNYGLDLTLERFFNDNFYFLWTASFFRSFYRASDNIVRSSQFDNFYATKFLFGYEFVFKRSSLSLGFQTSLIGGRPYTPPNIEESDRLGVLVRDDTKRHSLRFDDYFRLDAKINYKIQRAKITHEIGLDIVNVTNKDNIFGLRYVPDNDNDPNNNIRFENQLGLLPLFFYRVDF